MLEVVVTDSWQTHEDQEYGDHHEFLSVLQTSNDVAGHSEA